MELMETILNRRSIRHYLPRTVEREKILRIIEAGRVAPSAKNGQEWRYIVVTDQQKRQELMRAAAYQRFVAEAPVVIVACAETDGRTMQCGQLAYPIDVAISMDHITLKAVEEGLGTCWIGAFDAEMVKKIISMPAHFRVVELLTLGYPAKIPKPRSRYRLEEILQFEEWK